MTFNKCSIAGRIYGEVLDKFTGDIIEDPAKVEFSLLCLNKSAVQSLRQY